MKEAAKTGAAEAGSNLVGMLMVTGAAYIKNPS